MASIGSGSLCLYFCLTLICAANSITLAEDSRLEFSSCDGTLNEVVVQKVFVLFCKWFEMTEKRSSLKAFKSNLKFVTVDHRKFDKISKVRERS